MRQRGRRAHARVASALAVALCLGLPLQAEATTVQLLSPEELARASSVVAVVEVLSVDVVAGNGLVETRSRIRVERAVHGAPKGKVLTLVTPGGEYDGVTQLVPGAPRPQAGERALVFLERAGGGRFLAVGMEQGYLRIVDEEDGPVIERTSDARYLTRDPSGEMVATRPPPTREPLMPLLERVRLALESGR